MTMFTVAMRLLIPNEYADLQVELRGIGYDACVVRKDSFIKRGQ